MTLHRLLLSASERELQRLPSRDFLWRPPPEPSSFRTDIGPRLVEYSGVARRNIEFLRLGVLAYLTDRTAPRTEHSWLRSLELQVPVWDREPWLAVTPALERLLGFLTNDRWSITYRQSRTPRSPSTGPPPAGPAAALFSGGADSLAGAVLAEHELGEAPILVSHRDWSIVTGAQKALIERLTGLWGTEPQQFTATVGRSRRQIGSTEIFPQEETSRARSLLFIGLGLAVASVHNVPLRIAENGFASLNPPMGGERRGALSTRTTHPFFLAELSRILDTVGAHSEIENPFAYSTKSQMFRDVVGLIGSERASHLLSASHSCARGDIRFARVQGVLHCGVCFGCLVRRAAFRGAGLEDRTAYVIQDLTTKVGAFNNWYNEKRSRDLQAVRYAAHRGVDVSDVTRSLPPNLIQ